MILRRIMKYGLRFFTNENSYFLKRFFCRIQSIADLSRLFPVRDTAHSSNRKFFKKI